MKSIIWLGSFGINDMSDKIKYTKSTGNVFADIGFKNAKERLVKAELALKINQLIEERDLKQIEAAKILGINQPKISAIANGRLNDFSIERLIDFLNKLDQDVEIFVHEKPKRTKRAAHFTVAFACRIEDDDPVLGNFLSFNAKGIQKNKKNIQPISLELYSRAKSLVSDVEIDLDAPLSDKDE